MTVAVGDILGEQAASGAFSSTVWLDDGPRPDENGFVTALVVSALGGVAETPDVAAARDRALDFIARCERPDRPGAFGFYPLDAHPSWMPIPLPADADDTALFALALVRGGRREPAWLAEVVARVLSDFRLAWISGTALPWYRAGAFFTWLDERFHPNVVDLCVNVNVAALLQATGPGGAEAVSDIVGLVEAGLAWAGPSPERARMLSPYYPDPMELMHAVERAVAQGVAGLEPSLAALRTRPWARDDPDSGPPDGRPVCGSADRRIVWTAPVLQKARRLRSALEAAGPSAQEATVDPLVPLT